MNSIQQIVNYNIFHLEQGRRLLQDLTDRQYSFTDPPIYESGVGEHLRHVLEHYSCFLEGLPSRNIDYDARRRDLDISSDKAIADRSICDIVRDLKNLNSENTQVVIKMASSDDGSESSPASDSTLKRELQYLLAHTVHHFALIAFILRSQGVSPHNNFGVAPSTLRFRQETAETE